MERCFASVQVTNLWVFFRRSSPPEPPMSLRHCGKSTTEQHRTGCQNSTTVCCVWVRRGLCKKHVSRNSRREFKYATGQDSRYSEPEATSRRSVHPRSS